MITQDLIDSQSIPVGKTIRYSKKYFYYRDVYMGYYPLVKSEDAIGAYSHILTPDKMYARFETHESLVKWLDLQIEKDLFLEL